MTISRLAILAFSAFISLLAGCDNQVGPTRKIAVSDCRLPKLPVAAQCATLDVPENRDKPGGRKISIAIAILPANTLSPRPDPLFILAGGPGQAARYLGTFAASLTGVRKDRDIVLVDQRGTGRSSPLECAAMKPDENPDSQLELDPVPKATECAKELAAQGIDAAQYTTAAWIADLDQVREALGYTQVNLWGGSYGTRVALEYIRKFPSRVRSAILDGVAPPSMIVSLDVWRTRDAALSAVLDACAQSEACRTAHPDLPARLAAIRDKLGAEGINVTFTDPRTGVPRQQRITFDHIIGALQPLTYAPEISALTAEIIGRVGAGDYGPLYASLLFVTGDLADQLNNALYYSVTCAEDAPRIAPEDVKIGLADIRAKSLAERVLAVCNIWPKGSASPEASKPVLSDIPILLFSGALDPVTPPANGAEVAKTLRSARHIVARGYGHIVSPHACGPRLIAAFIDDPTFATLPASCVEHFEKSTRPPLWPDRLEPRF
jgi:pimeloyl-ACP methyl ester carboxylesterase